MTVWYLPRCGVCGPLAAPMPGNQAWAICEKHKRDKPAHRSKTIAVPVRKDR